MEAIQHILERFESGSTLYLTKEEERAILEYSLLHGDFLGAGSSRAVYSLGKDYVVKVAISDEGLLQHSIEREFYAELAVYGLFADLYASGHTINICERLTQLDELEDVNESLFIDIVSELNDITNYDGGDNEQIGFSPKRKKWVAYDYGYNSDYCRENLVGCMYDWVNCCNVLEIALEALESGQVPDSETLNDRYAEFIEEEYEQEEE